MTMLAARLLVTVFCWMTCLYALIASSTFAYLQFLRPRVFPWTGAFADWHASLGWVWLVLLLLVIGRDLRRAWRGRPAAVLLAGLAVGAVSANSLHPVLPRLTNDVRSLVIAGLALLPLVWLALLDVVRHAALFTAPVVVDRSCSATDRDASAVPDSDNGDVVLLNACLLSAVTLAVVHLLLSLVNISTRFEPDLMDAGLIAAFGHSVLSHLTVFIPLFLATALVNCLAGGDRRRGVVVWSAVLIAGVAVLFDRLISDPLSVIGAGRPALATMAGLAVVGTWGGVQLARRSARRLPLLDPLELFVGRLSARSGASRLAVMVGVALCAWGMQQLSAVADWDDVVQRLATTVVWVLTFSWAFRTVASRSAPRVSNLRLALVCAAPLVAVVISANATLSESGQRAQARYSVYDPSYRMARRLTTRETATPAFTRYLRDNTGLTDVALVPQTIDQVAALSAVPEVQRPPIFLFVVDSLRHDYLGPYNTAAWFTPNIAAFARDSVVFANAFTRYGGTGLSVPAIWAGSALPHKQYVTPFAPMNSLDKLLDANGYRRFIGLDSIMVQLLRRTALLTELDKGVTVMDYELCTTLGELEAKLVATPAHTPVFAYSLPQDVHMSRLGHWTTPVGDFTGFFAPYAGRIQSMDACLGRFIATLRHLGLYDRSLIILTSDHGELLGEDGQFGHSYHMVPTVVRVPLIVHLPESVAATQRVDPDAIALSTDITPTIYAALGYRLEPRGRLLGRPLIGEDDEALAKRRRDRYVLAASYGAVYAVVSRNGRRIYVADAIKGDDHLYERTAATPWEERAVTADVRTIEQFAIRQHIDELAKVFAVPERDRR